VVVTHAASLTLLTDLLARHSRALVDRTRRWAPPTWRQPAGRLGSSADVLHHLVGALAALERGLAAPAAALLVPRRPSYDAALSDQLAVVAHDLVKALRTTRPGALAEDVPVERVAALALAETLLHGYACDHRLPEETAAQAATARLRIAGGPPYADALLAAGDCLLERG
jgi:hypothetical protein